jgi:hypothetical protein
MTNEFCWQLVKGRPLSGGKIGNNLRMASEGNVYPHGGGHRKHPQQTLEQSRADRRDNNIFDSHVRGALQNGGAIGIVGAVVEVAMGVEH